jgi:hypothetical protein
VASSSSASGFSRCLNPLSRKISYCVAGGPDATSSSASGSSSSSLEEVEGLLSRAFRDFVAFWLTERRAFLCCWA